MSMRQLKITNSITNRESQGLDVYLREISKEQLVSPEEEVQLSLLIKSGDKTALHRLTRGNLRFVVSVAKQYQGQGLSLSDLINEGNLGLIKAAERFDDTRGFRFISFAVWWIRQSILQALAEHARTIRLPMHKVALGKRIHNTHSQLEQQLERAPSAEELAEALDMHIDEVNESLGLKARPVSLDSPLSDDEDNTLIDTLENHNAEKADVEVYHKYSLKLELSRSLKALPERQRQTICYFFGIGVDMPLSLDDIARKFDVTTERVRQIKDKALEKLRAMQNFNSLRDFLGA